MENNNEMQKACPLTADDIFDVLTMISSYKFELEIARDAAIKVIVDNAEDPTCNDFYNAVARHRRALRDLDEAEELEVRISKAYKKMTKIDG